MNGLTVLIVVSPALAAVWAFKKAERQEHLAKPKPKAEAFQWPKKWHPPVSKTGDR